MVTKRYLALDIGASNGRAILGEFDGKRLRARDAYHFPNEPLDLHGNTYWDVLRLFREIKNGLLRYSAEYGPKLDGIAIDTWGVDSGFFDRDGRLLGNPHHHRDVRFAGMAQEIRQLIDGYDHFARTGVMVQQVATITQMYALARNRSPQLEVAERFLMIPSIFNYFLTGVMTDEHSNISNTGLVSFADGKPLTDVLEKLGIPARIVPPAVSPGQIVGRLLAPLGEELGLREPPVIACATHDSASAVISVPADPSSEWAFLSCGTWSVMGYETETPVVSREAYERYLTTADTADGKLMSRLNVTGLWLVQECRRIWSQSGREIDYGEMVDLARQSPEFTAFIDVDNPDFIHPPDMPGAIREYLTRTRQSMPADEGTLLRIIFESMALKYREMLEMIEETAGRKFDVLHLVGGGVRNSLLCQLTANALGIPVVAGPAEATSSGNLLMQLISTGEISSVAEGRMLLRPSFELSEYRPVDKDAWDQAYGKFRETIRRDNSRSE